MKIFLTCPNCGNGSWVRREESFECLACGEVYDPEDMCATAEDEEEG